MIADHPHYIRAARNNSLRSIAVTYGFTDKEQLATELPEFLADSPQEISSLLIDR
jgi:phosphoglycolate phosphatase-like HAD superfamily hydrolase